ncbi:MAG: DHH family phosphoesterase, partial [Alphaproteobacteria bacterium]
AFTACGELVAAGADFMNIAKRVYIDTSAARLRLLARVLSSLQMDHDDLIAGVVCTDRDLQELELSPADLETFVEHPRAVVGVKAAYLLREEGDGIHIKGSLRANDNVDVAQVAAQFGGGGHTRAAGFRTQGKLGDIRARLVAELKKAVDRS